jgi:hypothetical protein
VLFQGGKAVWIEGGNIYYVSKFNFTVALSDISEVRDGISERTGNACVFIRTRGGEQKLIPTTLLVEESDVIADKLRTFLRSPVAVR